MLIMNKKWKGSLIKKNLQENHLMLWNKLAQLLLKRQVDVVVISNNEWKF